MKQTRIKRISPKEKARRRKWNELVLYLIQYRARGKCEECHKDPDFRGLQGHHIITRARGGGDSASNCLICCGNCHNHAVYSAGIPLAEADALELVSKLNAKYDIKL